jgi:hypothetical protein
MLIVNNCPSFLEQGNLSFRFFGAKKRNKRNMAVNYLLKIKLRYVAREKLAALKQFPSLPLRST